MEGFALWKPPLEGGEEQETDARELLITVYRSPAPASVSTAGPRDRAQRGGSATLDTNWGSLLEDVVTIVSEEEAEAWRERQRVLTRGHIKTILRLAKMSVSTDPDVLLPLVLIYLYTSLPLSIPPPA